MIRRRSKCSKPGFLAHSSRQPLGWSTCWRLRCVAYRSDRRLSLRIPVYLLRFYAMAFLAPLPLQIWIQKCLLVCRGNSGIIPGMRVIQTKQGWRLSQHGVVVSELRTSAGPTHSVFDVLAALITVLNPQGQLGMMGFAGGGMMAPLRALGRCAPITAVDLDRASYDLFCRHCPEWAAEVHWHQADAFRWLRGQSRKFDLLLDDLSVPRDGDVVKPDGCWDELPRLMRQRLQPKGVALFNLLTPPDNNWPRNLARVKCHFATARVILLDDFENRILVAGAKLPTATSLGRALRQSLRHLRSRQAGRLQVRSL